MHILFLTDNFPPEVNAPATRTIEHAREWVRQGHRVTVITCAPNFPHGKVFPGYANRFRCEMMDGIRVLRVPTFIHANEGFLLRSLDYASFIPGALWAAWLRVRRADVVVATSPQFFCAVAGWLASRVRRAPFVFEVRDLWPASIAAVGATKQGLVLRMLERLELFLYRRARAVITVTRSFVDDIVTRGIDRRKLAVVRNGVDLSRYAPVVRDAAAAEAWGLGNRIVFGYLGTHGMAHALDNVLAAADLLRDDPRIHVLFVGAGAAKAGLEAKAASMGLTNVSFHGVQPKERMPTVWGLCDVALVHLSRSELFASVIPSKIFEAMGMGLPILYVGPAGEASDLVTEPGAGVWVPPEDPAALAAALRRMADDQAGRLAMGRAARAAAPLHDRTRLAHRLSGLLQVTVHARRHRAAAPSGTLDASAANIPHCTGSNDLLRYSSA